MQTIVLITFREFSVQTRRSNEENKRRNKTWLSPLRFRRDSSYIIVFLRQHNEPIIDNTKTKPLTPCFTHSVYVLSMTSQSITQCIVGPDNCCASTKWYLIRQMSILFSVVFTAGHKRMLWYQHNCYYGKGSNPYFWPQHLCMTHEPERLGACHCFTHKIYEKTYFTAPYVNKNHCIYVYCYNARPIVMAAEITTISLVIIYDLVWGIRLKDRVALRESAVKLDMAPTQVPVQIVVTDMCIRIKYECKNMHFYFSNCLKCGLGGMSHNTDKYNMSFWLELLEPVTSDYTFTS